MNANSFLKLLFTSEYSLIYACSMYIYETDLIEGVALGIYLSFI